MKYKIKRYDDGEVHLTLAAKGERELVILHDDVAVKIAKPSQFIGDVYTSVYEKKPKESSGEVLLKEEKDNSDSSDPEDSVVRILYYAEQLYKMGVDPESVLRISLAQNTQ